MSKTFHWPRQLQSVKSLVQRFTLETLSYLCPGANTGSLRGRRVVERAYEQLSQLDLEVLRHDTPVLPQTSPDEKAASKVSASWAETLRRTC